MLETLLGVGLGFGLLAYLLAPDEELNCIKNGAEGKQIDIHKLAAAYWNKYSATYVPESQWLTMKRHEKSAVLAKREELEKFFANFDPAVQRKVQSVRLKNSSVLRSNRITEKLMQADVPQGDTIGIVLSIGGQFGFVRPVRSMTSYFFHTSDVLWGMQHLVEGDTVLFKLGENQKGLCAKSVRKHFVP